MPPEPPPPPPPYTSEVEFIESAGRSWIDTGVIPTTSTIVQCKFRNIAATDDVILGYYAGSDTQDWRIFNGRGAFWFDWLPQRLRGWTPHVGVDTEIELGNYYVKELTTGTIVLSDDHQTTDGVKSIKLNYNEGDGHVSLNRWYWLKIYAESRLIRDFIPVRVNDVGCLYDRVEGVIYENQGSDPFVIGPDVNQS